MRVSPNETPPSGKGNGTMAGVTRDSESGTLSALSKEAVDKLVKRVNARRSTRLNKQDDVEECAASPRSSLGRNDKQVSDARVTWNDLDGRDVVEDSGVHCSREAVEGGSQNDTCNIDEEMEDADWEDGVTRLSSLNYQHVDSTSELTIEFNDSPSDSTPRKAVRRATAEEKELAELVHKVHLLCLLARGRIIDNACDDPLIQASLLSLLPEHLSKLSKISNLAARNLASLVCWFHNYFRVSCSFGERGAFRSSLLSAIENCEGTPEEVAALSVALLRALGLTARFVSILDVVSIKPEADVSGSSPQGVNQVRRNIFKTATLMVDKTKEVLCAPVESFTDNKGENSCETSEKIPSNRKEIHSSSNTSRSIDSSATGKFKNQLLESISEINEDISKEPGTSTSLGAKRKGDMEFEMQLQMALSATAVVTPQRNIESGIQSSHSNASDTCTPWKRLRRITGGELSSQGVSTAVGSRKVGPPLYWAEVHCTGENLTGKWVHVDSVNAIVDGEDRVEAAAAACKTPLRYVVAFAGSGAKDVTRRYCKKWHKIASQRVNSCWWDAVLAPLRELESGATDGHVKFSGDRSSSEAGSSGTNTFSATRDSMEDMELETRALTEPLPTNQQAYRSHHLYAIERWLTKYQILHPKGPVLGFCSGHPVYPRSCVQLLKTKDRWLREALQVKANELPAKALKRSKRLNKDELCEEDDYPEVGSNGTIELYGRWQLEPLQLPHAVNGIVPKNERGQVDVWSEKCLPLGTAHIRLPRVFQIAKTLEIDYSPAMVGFDFKNGKSVPVFDGIVVCSEFKNVILEAYAEEEERRDAAEKKRTEAQAVSRWYQLLSSIVTRQRLSNTYGDALTPEAPARVDDSQAAGANRSVEVFPKCQEKNMKRFKDDVPLEGHEHVFLAKDQTFDVSTSMRTKRCRCGFSVEVEEM